MSVDHTGGNLLNQLALEEHDGTLNAHRVVSTATIYAVVNTSAAGVGQSIVTVANPVSIAGNITISDSKGFIGLVTIGGGTVGTSFSGNVTLDAGSKTGIVGNVTLSDSKAFIGLTTVVQASSVRSIAGNVTLDAGSRVGVLGNITLSDPKTFIGLVTVVQSSAVRSIAGNITITSGTVSLTGNLTLSDSKAFIGLVTVVQSSTARTITGNVTISDSKTFIGLVTAWSRNAGTTKTMINLPVSLSTSSVATIAVPTGGNALFYITQNLISSDATVRVSIKSGVTYLTGNASIGITLNPGGGWVENGGVDAPNYVGLASGAAIVIEKFDMTATKANVGGKIMYFQE